LIVTLPALFLSGLPALLTALASLTVLAVLPGLIALLSRLFAVLTSLSTLLSVLFQIICHKIVLPIWSARLGALAI
jgi:hypothetical protein